MILFSETSRKALEPTKPLIQWEPAFIPGVKRPGREVDLPFPSAAEIENEWSCAYTPKYPFVAPRGKTVVLLHALVHYI